MPWSNVWGLGCTNLCEEKNTKPVQTRIFCPLKNLFLGFILLFGALEAVHGQAPDPPIPVEMLVGHERLYFQLVVKKQFSPASRLGFFTVATYTASYRNEQSDNSITIPVQVSYALGKGFGVMTGTDINSVAGFAPVVGPQYNFASRQFLAVTVASFFLNEDSDFKIFGLYEYKPPLGAGWALYNRLQFIYNVSLSDGTHNRSYLYLRSGLKRGSFIFGLGANLDQYGPKRKFKDNYGLFVRWEFK